MSQNKDKYWMIKQEKSSVLKFSLAEGSSGGSEQRRFEVKKSVAMRPRMCQKGDLNIQT